MRLRSLVRSFRDYTHDLHRGEQYEVLDSLDTVRAGNVGTALR